jgi:hypothetical protein
MKKNDLLQKLGIQDSFVGFSPLADAVLEGWNGDSPFLTHFVADRKPRLVIEVGTWLGLSAANFGLTLKKVLGDADFSVICIDTWLGSLEHWIEPELTAKLKMKCGRPTLYEQFLSNMLRIKLEEHIVPIPLPSQIAAHLLKHRQISSSLIYLDGSHDEKDIYDDLVAYWPIVESGGVILGDDWKWDSVRAGVGRFASENQIQPIVHSNDINWVLPKA